MRKFVYSILIILIVGLFLPYFSYADKQQTIDIDIGDEIVFGNYLQGMNDKEPTPISWIVLAKNKNKLTVLSKKLLELMPFHDVYEGAYWPKSSLRKWLNNDFFKIAFSKEEQRAILNSSHSYYIYNNELKQKKQNSQDKVFLLSISEAIEYLTDSRVKKDVFGFSLSPYDPYSSEENANKQYYRAEITSYANRDHMFGMLEPINGIIKTWWLCDSYAGKDFASYTGSQDSRFLVHYERVMEMHGVRPAMVIDINKLSPGSLQKNKDDQSHTEMVTISAQESDYTVMLGFKVNFHRNRLFSKYDVSLYVDDDLICDLSHGVNKEATCRLKKGKHTVYFYKKDDHSVVTKKDITVTEHSYMVCSISTNRNGVDLSDVEFISRYRISDPKMLACLKEYDTIVDKLALEYDSARHRREHSGRTDYEDFYFLLGSKSKSALCFIAPKYINNENPVTIDTGYYTGDLSSEKVKVVLNGGNTYTVSSSANIDINEQMQGFYSVCRQLIRYVYPQIHEGYLSLRTYLYDNDRELLDLIFFD